MSEPTPNPPAGAASTVARIGSYRLIEQLGSGGMSNVYRAVHVDTGHEVAVKILPRSLARNATMLQRFLREAKSAESLQDPFIVPIFDRGVENGRYYIVLEYLPGGDLFERVRECGPLPIHEAVDIVRTVARGLMHAAEQGLIHRDIKPANLLLTSDARVKITDLGLAMQMVEDDERVTRDGTTVGTVDYMSPEQARDSRATTIRSDIYSLGCTLYFLLAGEPPFVGGDVPEKLRRHAYDPPPDVRDKRPEVPEGLAELIQRMMAKRPERRFVDYEHLIEAIDELPIAPPGEVKEAILDDDEPGQSGVTPRPPSRAGSEQVWFDDILNPSPPTAEWPHLADGGVLKDLLSEDVETTRPPSNDEGGAYGLADDSGGFALGPTSETKPRAPGSTQSAPAWPLVNGGRPIPAPPRSRIDSATALPTEPPRDVNIAALAQVEETGEALARPKPIINEDQDDSAVQAPVESSPEPSIAAAPVPIPMLPASVVEEILAPEVSADKFPAISLTRVLQAALVLLLLVFVGIGLRHALGWWNEWARKAEIARENASKVANTEVAEADTVPLIVPRPATTRASTRPSAARPWTEPEPPAVKRAPAPAFDAELLGALELTNTVAPAAEPAPTPVVTVRRGTADDGKQGLDSLRKAFDLLTGTIEIADDGPFFEQDLRINGATRAVRAAENAHVMIAYEKPTLQSARTRPAVFAIDGKNITIEGVDLVVRASDLTPRQTAIFLCRKGSLTLRDCTITIDGSIERSLAVFQLGSIDPDGSGGEVRLRLERTLVRAPGATTVHIADGDSRVELVECMTVAGGAPALRVAGPADAKRRIAIIGSLVTTSGPLVELAGSAAGRAAQATKFRVLDSLLVHLDGSMPAGLVVHRDPAGGASHERAAVDWLGDGNTFVGWQASSSAQQDPMVVADLAGLQSLNSKTDSRSRAIADSWTSTPTAWSSPQEIAGNDKSLKNLAARVAQPSPNLSAWTISTLEPLATKGPAPLRSALELEFDADSESGTGDLGRFLAKNVPPDSQDVRVRVRGSGRKWMTPIRMRDGVSLEIEVISTSPDAPLFWLPAEGATADAMIRVSEGDLVLRNARFERDARAVMRHVIELRQGRLFMENCRVIAPFQVEPGGGNLILFETVGTRPLGMEESAASFPLCRLNGCVLMTGGVALNASVGRGIIQLEQCAIGSGDAAIELAPQKVASERLVADLQLDHCTIVAERDVVRMDAWLAATGPDRPWLVSTNACVLMDGYDREGAPSTTVLLRVDPTSLMRRGVLWQSQGDVLGLTRFVATTDAEARPSSFPDINRDWVAFWGANHIQAVRSAKGLLTLARGKIAPGKLKPEDFALVPAITGQPLEVGADPARLGLKSTLGK